MRNGRTSKFIFIFRNTCDLVQMTNAQRLSTPQLRQDKLKTVNRLKTAVSRRINQIPPWVHKNYKLLWHTISSEIKFTKKNKNNNGHKRYLAARHCIWMDGRTDGWMSGHGYCAGHGEFGAAVNVDRTQWECRAPAGHCPWLDAAPAWHCPRQSLRWSADERAGRWYSLECRWHVGRVVAPAARWLCSQFSHSIPSVTKDNVK